MANKDVKRLMDYVLEHPARNKVWPAWDNDQIELHVMQHLIDGEYVTILEDNKFIGCLFYSFNPIKNEVLIESILCDNNKALAILLGQWELKHPTAILTGMRRGKKVQYNFRHFRRYYDKYRTDLECVY